MKKYITDPTSRVPLYYQLLKQFEEKLNCGAWKKGSAMPSERELCELYRVSRITVRNAVEELVKQGKVEKIQGKGTFVLGRNIVQNLGYVYSFSKEMEKQGKITATVLLKQEKIIVDQRLALQLGISTGDEVIYLERLRYADQQPLLLEKTYFPAERYSFVLTMDLVDKQLYKSLQEQYNIVIDKAFETFKACQLRGDELKLLEGGRSQFGLLIKRTSYAQDQLVCYSTIVAKGDVFEFTVKLVS